MAHIHGAFHAEMTPDGARAWLGDERKPTRWPEGCGVRFDPTELIGPDGAVVAREGDAIAFAGGGFPETRWTAGAEDKQLTTSIESWPSAGPRTSLRDPG
jgi:hypothetical protein